MKFNRFEELDMRFLILGLTAILGWQLPALAGRVNSENATVTIETATNEDGTVSAVTTQTGQNGQTDSVTTRASNPETPIDLVCVITYDGEGNPVFPANCQVD